MNHDFTIRSAFQKSLASFDEVNEVLFTSFQFSASFFEDNVLPVLADLSFDEIKGSHQGIRKEINSRLENIRVNVICDASTELKPKGAYRYGLWGIRLSKSRFHPKMILLQGVKDGESKLLLLVTSANLTLMGWGRNEEVISAILLDSTHQEVCTNFIQWLQICFSEQFGDSWNEMKAEGELNSQLHDLILALKNLPVPRINEQSVHLLIQWPGSSGILEQLALDSKPNLKSLLFSPYWGDMDKLKTSLNSKSITCVLTKDNFGSYGVRGECPEKSSEDISLMTFGMERFRHAKILITQLKNNKFTCMAGSANATGTGIGFVKDTKLLNAEAVISWEQNSPPVFWKYQQEMREISYEEVWNGAESFEEGAPEMMPVFVMAFLDLKKMILEVRTQFFLGSELLSGCFKWADYEYSFETIRSRKILKNFYHVFLLKVIRKHIDRLFLLEYECSGEKYIVQGNVIILGASDIELGYKPQPQLNQVLDLLRSLNMEKGEAGEKQRRKYESLLDDPYDDELKKTGFDQFQLFQAFFKLQGLISEHPGDALMYLNSLWDSISGTSQDNDAQWIKAYLVCQELQECLNLLKRNCVKNPTKNNICVGLPNWLLEHECLLKEARKHVMDKLKKTPPPQKKMKAARFIKWFEKESLDVFKGKWK